MKTKYISVTRDKEIAINKYANGNKERVVEIDLNKYDGIIHDFSSLELASKLNFKKAISFAIKDKELLLEGVVSKDILKIIK